MEDWKKIVFCFCKNRLQSIYTSIVSCVYNLKTHTFFLVICGVSFFIPATCIVYVCSVLTSSIITSLENVSYIVSYPCLLYQSFGYSFLTSCSLVWDDCHAVGLLCFSFLLMGYLCLFLPHGLTNEYIISIFIFSVASIFSFRLITK